MSALLRSGRRLARLLSRTSSISSVSSVSSVMSSGSSWRSAASLAPLLRRLDDDVRRYGRLGRRDLDDILQELGLATAPTSSQSLLLLRCCGELVPEEHPTERTKLAQKIWNSLSDRKIPMDISHYNALLRVYVENNHEFSSADFLKNLESKGLEPNRVTYQRLMWHHCQMGDVEGASNILELMKEKQMPLSEAVLDALVLGHVRQDNLEGAHSVLAAMSAAGLNPTSKTYSIIMGGLAKRGDVEKIKELIKECEGKEIYFSDKDLLDVVEEFAAEGRTEHIDYVIGLVQKSSGYNQDAINAILRLVNRNRLDAAFQVLRSMTKSTSQIADEVPQYQSAFFIKQLIKSNVSAEHVMTICDRLQKEGISPKANYIAAECALQSGNVKLSLALFKSIQSAGDPMRQHYFWPILAARAKVNDVTSMLDVLRLMTEGYNVPVATETLKEYVVPNLIKKRDPQKVVEVLRESGVALAVTVRSTLLYLLSEDRLKEAADVAGIYGTRGYLKLYINPLVQALHKNNDIESFVKLVTLSLSDDQGRRNQDDEEVDDKVEQREAVGRLLNVLVSKSSKEFNREMLSVVLRKFLQNGLAITDRWADEIQKRLGKDIDNQVSQILAELVSEDLQVVSIEKGVMPQVRRSPHQIQNLITALEAKGENVDGLKRQYLTSLIRAKEYEKVEEVIGEFEASDIKMTSGMCAQILDMYTQWNQLEKALKYRETILAKQDDFNIDGSKILRLVQLMIKENRFDEAMEILSKHKQELEPEINFIRDSTCWQMLSALAEIGDVDKVNKIFAVLEENKYVKVTNVLLGSLIKVHLVNGNTNKALETFEEVAHKYHMTPWKSELNKRLIMDEDAVGLQKLTDLSTLIHGEVNSLYDLVFGFIECGRVKQARKILETPGMRMKNFRFNSICERYGEEGKVDYLESLLEATRELSHIDVSEVFQQLLKSYIQADETEKALGLWTLLQEDGVPPTDKFLTQLAKHLNSKNINVPFVVPTSVSSVENPVVIPVSKKPEVVVDNTLNKIKKSIEDGDLNTSGETVCVLLKSGKTIPPRLLRFVVNKISQSGNLALLDKIGACLNEELLRMVSFENKRCEVLCASGLTDEYLAGLEKGIDSATDEELSRLDAIFPKGGILLILRTKPQCYKHIKIIAEKYASRGMKSPMNSLWIYNFLQNDHDEAKNIWNEHLRNCDKILFRNILQNAAKDNDTAMLPKLLEYLKDCPNVTPRTLGNVYSKQMDLLLEMNKHNEANDVLKMALSSNITLQDFNSASLLKLKNAMEYSGLQFEYSI